MRNVARRTFLNAVTRSGIFFVASKSDSLVSLLAQSRATGQLIVHSARPEDLETPPHLLTSWITPNELFYVRSHFYTPAISEESWRLHVDGHVEHPLQLTLDAIKAMPQTAHVVTLECAGNGRAFFQPPVAGVQWRKGAVGTARWTGVRLRDVLREAGIRTGARHVWLDGADQGPGRAPDFVRNLPLEKALHPDTLLACEMSGEPLPLAHGFPLRAIVPGWEGAYSVKWLTEIRVADHEHQGAFVQSGYRYPKRPVAPGAAVEIADTVPLKGLVVKSLITAPAMDSAVPLGRVLITGVAWAGEDEIKHVEVSTDSGRTWKPARLGRDRAPYAWRYFEHEWHVREPGTYVVVSRAMDSRGNMQPLFPDWNPGGYLWNAVDQVRVNAGTV
jgi:DMSO/TMAO reductase YedYZ molybdopterin-dependent catalytic subunit